MLASIAEHGLGHEAASSCPAVARRGDCRRHATWGCQMRFRILRAIACATFVSIGMIGIAVSQDITPARLEQINAMSPEKMARTGAWTRANYDRMMTYIYSIEDRGIRSLVLDFVNNPRSTVFDATRGQERVSLRAGGRRAWTSFLSRRPRCSCGGKYRNLARLGERDRRRMSRRQQRQSRHRHRIARAA